MEEERKDFQNMLFLRQERNELLLSQSFFMSPEPEVDCRKELLKLDSLMEEALEKAPDMLEELAALAVRPGHLSERWNLTFNG